MIVTCRREKDGGRWVKSEEDRLMLLRQAIVAGVEYVDLEEDIAAKIPRFGKTKRIISYHNFQETPEDLTHLHARLSEPATPTSSRSPRWPTARTTTCG